MEWSQQHTIETRCSVNIGFSLVDIELPKIKDFPSLHFLQNTSFREKAQEEAALRMETMQQEKNCDEQSFKFYSMKSTNLGQKSVEITMLEERLVCGNMNDVRS
jgi:hypothetical protein